MLARLAILILAGIVGGCQATSPLEGVWRTDEVIGTGQYTLRHDGSYERLLVVEVGASLTLRTQGRYQVTGTRENAYRVLFTPQQVDVGGEAPEEMVKAIRATQMKPHLFTLKRQSADRLEGKLESIGGDSRYATPPEPWLRKGDAK